MDTFAEIFGFSPFHKFMFLVETISCKFWPVPILLWDIGSSLAVILFLSPGYILNPGSSYHSLKIYLKNWSLRSSWWFLSLPCHQSRWHFKQLTQSKKQSLFLEFSISLCLWLGTAEGMTGESEGKTKAGLMLDWCWVHHFWKFQSLLAWPASVTVESHPRCHEESRILLFRSFKRNKIRLTSSNTHLAIPCHKQGINLHT